MQQKMLVNINLQDILNNQKAIGICFDNLSDKIELDTILYNFYKNLIYLNTEEILYFPIINIEECCYYMYYSIHEGLKFYCKHN